MHPAIYREFERICTARGAGGRVLEIGAVPGESSLLCMKSLSGATEKVGINLDGPHRYQDFTILKGNANTMDCFEDGQFNTVLCNGVLEHDKFFWKTLREIRRVAAPGSLVVIGTPGYTRLPAIPERVDKTLLLRALRKLRWLDFVPAIFRSTPTLEIHAAPGDYYRFSAQTFREVFFEGMQAVEIRSVLVPPMLIGAGTIV
jgi:SAM-dependent methyltransferase